MKYAFIKPRSWYELNKDQRGMVNVPGLFVPEMAYLCGKLIQYEKISISGRLVNISDKEARLWAIHMDMVLFEESIYNKFIKIREDCKEEMIQLGMSKYFVETLPGSIVYLHEHLTHGYYSIEILKTKETNVIPIKLIDKIVTNPI